MTKHNGGAYIPGAGILTNAARIVNALGLASWGGAGPSGIYSGYVPPRRTRNYRIIRARTRFGRSRSRTRTRVLPRIRRRRRFTLRRGAQRWRRRRLWRIGR